MTLGESPGPDRLTVDGLLSRARAELVRVSPQQALEDLGRGSVLVDIRSELRRAADGLMPAAVHVPRDVLEWRADPRSGHPEPALGVWRPG